jgi:hypothetical protein
MLGAHENGGPKAAVGVLVKKPFPGAKSFSLQTP